MSLPTRTRHRGPQRQYSSWSAIPIVQISILYVPNGSPGLVTFRKLIIINPTRPRSESGHKGSGSGSDILKGRDPAIGGCRTRSTVRSLAALPVGEVRPRPRGPADRFWASGGCLSGNPAAGASGADSEHESGPTCTVADALAKTEFLF